MRSARSSVSLAVRRRRTPVSRRRLHPRDSALGSRPIIGEFFHEFTEPPPVPVACQRFAARRLRFDAAGRSADRQDLRGFTRLAERKLPYDVVFILNRYFEAVGGAITDVGGIVNQFTGDGVMALFGLGGGFIMSRNLLARIDAVAATTPTDLS